jgi:cold-inducible RNA-binding protein
MNLYIGNLNQETTASSLRRVFSEFGEVVTSKVIIDNATGMSRGFGFVEMADKMQAIDAIDNLDATFLEGNIISVKEAKQSNTGTAGRSNHSSMNRPNSNRPFRPRTTPRPRQGDFNNDRFNTSY